MSYSIKWLNSTQQLDAQQPVTEGNIQHRKSYYTAPSHNAYETSKPKLKQSHELLGQNHVPLLTATRASGLCRRC